MAKSKQGQEPELVRRDGGLCVYFVNAASAKRKSFSTYAELLAWGIRAGVLSAAEAQRLERAATERPKDAEVVARRAVELRSCLRRMLLTLADGRAPTAADLAALNAELGRALAARVLIAAGRGARWVWGDLGGDDLDRMLWPVAFSAADVLSTKYHLKVRQCAGKDCDLLFVDRTPGSPRRWCSMRICGSKVNSRRHYQQVVKPEIERSRRPGSDP